MAQIVATIAGRQFRLACEDGQEDHLQSLAKDIDQRIIDGMLTNDEEKLTGLPDNYFNSGTSEIRNWLVVAGAMSKGNLKMKLIDYIPCYRSAAGTGFGACFAEWL